MNNFATKTKSFLSSLPQKASEAIRLDQNKSTLRKIASSLWALFFGILISFIFIGFLNKSPFEFYKVIIHHAFEGYNKLWLTGYLTVFILGSLGVGVGFKAGYFNIGVSGQMMAAGMINYIVIFKIYKNMSMNNSILPVLLLIAILAGAFLGFIAGLLKAFFNVHEVISTILLNWIVVYLCSYLFNWQNGALFTDPATSKIFLSDLDVATKGLLIPFKLRQMYINVSLAISVILAVILWLVLAKTSLGYKIRMVGLNKTNAKYTGTNEKMFVSGILAFSGALSGYAGFIYYIIIQKQMSGLSIPVAIGFDTIAISLLALNAPIGIIFSSLLYAVLRSGQLALNDININSENMSMVTGLIIFLAALSLMFNHFRPIRFVYKYWLLYRDKDWKNNYQEHRNKISELKKERKAVLDEYRKEHQIIKPKAKTLKQEHKKFVDSMLTKKVSQLNDQDKIKYFDDLSNSKHKLHMNLQDIGYYNYKNKKLLYGSLLNIERSQFRTMTEKRFIELSDNLKQKYVQKRKARKLGGDK